MRCMKPLLWVATPNPYVDGIEVARDEQDPLQICDLKVEGAVEHLQPYGTYQ